MSGSSGEQWIQIRRLCLTVLRSFGVGKSSFEERIGTEGEELLKQMSAFDGKPFNPKPFFGSAVSNVISSVVFGWRYEYDDENWTQLLASLSNVVRATGSGGFFLVFQGLAQRLPFIRSQHSKLRSDAVGAWNFIHNIINSHRDTFDPHNMRDFIDVYLNELKKNNSGETAYTHLNETNMTKTVRDLFAAGSETTATTLEWCLLYMAIYPDIQQRVQAEIDAVVGRNRLPRLADKPDLNFTLAVLWEIQRMTSIVPLGLPHVAASDVQFRGFSIPKGTTLVSNLWAIFRDPVVWPDPEKFRAERFLTEEGKAFRPDEFIPFGIGEYGLTRYQIKPFGT